MTIYSLHKLIERRMDRSPTIRDNLAFIFTCIYVMQRGSYIFVCVCVGIFRATPAAYGSSRPEVESQL